MGTSASALSSLLSSASSPSGIDISSILEAALGSSSPGIDVTSAVNAAVTAAEAPEQTWETEESTLQSQVSALTQIQTDASTLDNDMQSLNSITGPLSAMTVNSSNANVVGVRRLREHGGKSCDCRQQPRDNCLVDIGNIRKRLDGHACWKLHHHQRKRNRNDDNYRRHRNAHRCCQ
jgi:hypothetical protein